jgi:hypothetical protein
MVDDMRPPRAVVRTFAERIAPILAERGFALAGAKQRYSQVYDGPMFVRTRATAVDRVVLHAESYCSPGWVTCLVLFAIEDSAILAIAPSWERVLFLSSLREVDFPKANLARLAMPPADTVRSSSASAACVRASMGLQLRAWGEPTAAGLLRRIADDRIEALDDELRERGLDRVDDARGARAVLRVATGEDRPCVRATPEPFYFQYEHLHAPFGD